MTESEKILTKHLSEKGRRGTPIQVLIPNILEAMEEYAQHKLASDGGSADVRFSVPEILGLKDSWDLVHILQKLIEASDILLNDKDYDGHGWELIKEARDKAEIKVLQISGNEI